MQSPDSLFSLPSRAIDQLAEQDWVYLDHFFSEAFLRELKTEALRAWNQELFKHAEIGRGSEKKRASEIRGDSIYWLEPPPLFLQRALQQIQDQLNKELWIGITHYETHFARYEPGTGYQEHIDQSPHAPHQQRLVSFVLYLNPSWEKSHGGQLSIRTANGQEVISPEWGRLVLFKSATVPHSVLASQAERWSLTGWFRKS